MLQPKKLLQSKFKLIQPMLQPKLKLQYKLQLRNLLQPQKLLKPPQQQQLPNQFLKEQMELLELSKEPEEHKLLKEEMLLLPPPPQLPPRMEVQMSSQINTISFAKYLGCDMIP